MKKIGLLAGCGRLPVEFTRVASSMGISVVAIGLVPNVDQELAEVASSYYNISAGELEKIIITLREHEITKVTMIGKVTKEHMFSNILMLDDRMRNLLAGLKDHSDDTIMLALVKELATSGIGVLDQTELIKKLMPVPSVLTKREPSEAELLDMEFGFMMARHIGGLDIGQTVVVKNRAVMAVEAIEGTDVCIKRGGQLGRGQVVVAKVAKPNQDMRFDVPAVGVNTLEAMIEAKATALVIEAYKTLVIDREKVIKLADENNITIVAKE